MAPVMKRRRLGKTDIEVSPIGLGCWQLSQGHGFIGRFWPSLDESVTKDIVAAALEGGIDWFDTAEVYGWGRSEEGLAKALLALGAKGRDVRIADKWWPLLRRARSITHTIDDRLRALSGLPIDLYQIHNAGSLSSVAAQMDAMMDLLSQGKIRGVGVSNFSAASMRKAQAALATRGYSLASNQVKYSLLDRRIERNGVLDAAKELGITLIAYSPLEQGILTGKFHEDPTRIAQRGGRRSRKAAFQRAGLEKSAPLIEALRRIATNHQCTPAQVALNWLLNFHGDLVVAIPGATAVHHARESAGAMAFELSRGELDELDQLSRAVAA